MEGDLYKILIVDDVPANLRLLASILKNSGYTLLEAENGEDAIRLAKELKPHLILLDVMMPGLDGFETCERLKNDPETADIVVIFISAKNTVTDKVRGLELGAVDFISKPFHKAEVVARVQTHLDLEIAHRELVRSEENYQTLIENVKDGIFLWNYDGIVFANSAFAAMLGYENTDSLKGLALENVISLEDANVAENEISSVLVGRQSGGCLESNLRMKKLGGGEIITNCFLCYVVYSGEPCVLVTVRDMTEHINLERQLNQAQKVEALGLLTSGIAHDFNNILALINGYTELAMMESEENSSIREKLNIIFEAGKSAISLTNGLLSFGKKKNMDLKPVNMGQELKRVYGFLQRGLPKNIKFTLELPEEQVSAYLDAGQFEQVIVNLCLNARDAMSNGGTLKIYLEREDIVSLPPHAPEGSSTGRYLAINVADSGDGIPQDVQDNIFNPFFTTKKEGTGLGLAMVERIVRNHKGWVSYETKQNKGTVFKLYIPELQEDDSEIEDLTSYVHQTHGDLKKILVLDDDKIQVSMIQHFLEKEDYSIVPMYSAKQALEFLEKSHQEIGLVILDWIMPEISGGICAKTIQEKWPEIKVIIISGAGGITICDHKLLRKPFSSTDLLRAIDDVVYNL